MSTNLFLAAESSDALSGIITMGGELFEQDIDAIIFQTNEFLTDASFTGEGGPFWMILQMCMCLGALFAIIAAAGMAYKMMIKGEPFDPLKIIRVLGIAIIMFWWYPTYGGYSILDGLAYIPNCIGSYTHDLYEAEAVQVQDKFDSLKPLFAKRDSLMSDSKGQTAAAKNGPKNGETEILAAESLGTDDVTKQSVDSEKIDYNSTVASIFILIDKLGMFLALLMWRIGWWGTIYVQQIMLGMLTIFGPIMWAFSVLPKWEGAWAKWLSRYLTVHFYGAMLYFVGFYVLLLFDVALSVQIEELEAITESADKFKGYINAAFITGFYMLACSVVSIKCLNLVPDLAAWMIPEGDVTFSARSFGDGVAGGMKQGVNGMASKVI